MEAQTISIGEAVDRIRREAISSNEKGQRFEGLVQMVLKEDPLYAQRFAEVLTWGKWAEIHGESRQDYGIDLVAKERSGGWCAIQCKFRDDAGQIQMGEVSNFIAASNRSPFITRILAVDGGGFSASAERTISKADPTCQIFRPRDLHTEVETGTYRPMRQQPYALRPHQQQASEDVLRGFEGHDRGKLIMACGTGKTFTSLRIAEEVVGKGGRVLYLVPSIALLQQSMREWAEQQVLPHRYVGICSDSRAGKAAEDVGIDEVEIPVTTDPARIASVLAEDPEDAMQVVYCTYQSLNLVEEAQKHGVSEFDLVVCDEAHRTTGVEKDGKVSGFSLIHDGQRILAKKRLYMTATPRLYTQNAKAKAESRDVGLFSMDDEEVYGPQFHRLSFSKSIKEDLLSDYKVVVISLSESHVSANVQAQMEEGGEILMNDAAKILGCWRALQDPEDYKRTGIKTGPLRRAIAFANTINTSKSFAERWNKVTAASVGWADQDIKHSIVDCEVRHVDGKMNSLRRKDELDWLRADSTEQCNILSNARCLSEGIDVPALDAVMFVNPRNSYVDIVQAVGRVMRKAKGKDFGYIILPVVVPSQADPAAALDNNKTFGNVWSVLRALRAHDDRMNAEVNTLDLNNGKSERIIFMDGNPSSASSDDLGRAEENMGGTLPLRDVNMEPGMFYAKVVEKCGDRLYWQNWAKDVASIHEMLVKRINILLHPPPPPQSMQLQQRFQEFVEDLQNSINESISEDDAVEMLSQHILTQPVFDALFKDYSFAKSNPVSIALESLRQEFGGMGLDEETRALQPFYLSVAEVVRNLKTLNARQHVLEKLYENFFQTAMKKTADRLGIVYTPRQIVDFILFSADHALQMAFGKRLTDEKVHILDPFAGTGQFIVRLFGLKLIEDKDIARKYSMEVHSNEMQLLAYYISCVHIEQAYHKRVAGEKDNAEYCTFEGSVLCDTFNLSETSAKEGILGANSKRVERQTSMPITVIIGNPPYSIGQRRAADNNPNTPHLHLEDRIRCTYAEATNAKRKTSLYDSYKKAFRWAADRIGDRGVIAFVTPSSWLDGLAEQGVRACFRKEFSSIYVLNCRGNIKSRLVSPGLGESEGGNVFGQGCTSPIAITVLVKGGDLPQNEECKIWYQDIGEGLSTEDKRNKISKIGCIDEGAGWVQLHPGSEEDWLIKRSGEFQKYVALGSDAVKRNMAGDAVFALFSRGVGTGKDMWLYDFSHSMVESKSSMLTDIYEMKRTGATVDMETGGSAWTATLLKRCDRNQVVCFDRKNIRVAQYRPYCQRYLYFDSKLIDSKYQTDKMFPSVHVNNPTIVVPGKGGRGAFSTIVVNNVPDMNILDGGAQCFPRYRAYSQPKQLTIDVLQEQGESMQDNITDEALKRFQVHYACQTIDKDQIFSYVYGILHSPEYRERFSEDIRLLLPRVPFSKNFQEFVSAGEKLVKLHLNYESCEEYPLTVTHKNGKRRWSEGLRIQNSMKFVNDKTVIKLNENVEVSDIPIEAHRYVISGRSPLEWAVNQYRVKRDKATGFVMDPNGAFDRPGELISKLQRLTYISVETVRIVTNLPPLEECITD